MWETIDVAKAQVVKEPNALVRYLRETRVELGKVNWPTRQEATHLTGIVLIVVTSASLVLGTLDFLFSSLFRLIFGF